MFSAPPTPMDCLIDSLSALHSLDKNLNDEGAKCKISSVSEFINYLDDKKYEADVATYFKKFGRVLVIQETNIQKLFDNNQGKGYRVAASSIGGLHPSHLKYIKRIHVIIDSMEGSYFADHLGDNYHYQIAREFVTDFLFDAYKYGRKIKVAGINCASQSSELGTVFTIPVPSDDEPDVVVYTSFTPVVVSMGSGRVLVQGNSAGGTDTEGPKYETVTKPSIIVCSNDSNPLENIQTKDFCEYLHNKDNGADNCGSFERNQYNTISFGFNALDTTDVSREELYHLPSPTMSKRYDKFPGLGNDDTMTITLANLAADLTFSMDKLFSAASCEKVFDDSKRSDLFARKIHDNNRFEKITISVSEPAEYLSSHTDSQNSEKLGYSGNYSVYSYNFNKRVNDPTKPGYLRRIHIGGYGRKACDSIMKRSTRVGELIQRVHEEIAVTPQHRISLNPDSILIPLEGDKQILSTNKATRGSPVLVNDMVARVPHLNKHIFYSFYVNVLSEWIEQKRKADDPVNWIELLQAVFSAVRWTSSPSNFAVVFRQLTNEQGASITIPKGVCWDQKQLKVPAKEEKKMPSKSLPLWLSFLFLIREESGGVNRGACPRFQQFAHHDIDIAAVEQSVQAFISHVNELRNTTSMSCDKDTHDGNTNKRNIKAVKTFVKAIASSSKSGGVFGLGELLAYHIVGILSTGGWLDPNLIRQCTDFSSGNNTAFYLLRCYDLNIRTNKGIIDAIATALPREFYSFEKLAAENIICECARSDSFGANNTSFDTVMIGQNAFIPDIDSEGMVARMKKNRTRRLISGVVSDAIGIQNSDDSIVDLRVADSSADTLLLIQHAFVKKSFPCSNGYNDGKRKAAKVQKKRKKNKHLPNVYPMHQPKWGYKPYSKKRIKFLKHNRMRAMAESVVQEYFNNVVGIASSFSDGDSTILDSLSKMRITNCRQFTLISLQVQQMFAVIGESPLSVEDDPRNDGSTYYKNEMATYVRNFHDLVFNGNTIKLKKKRKRVSRCENSDDDDDYCGSDEDYKDMDEMQISTYCIGAKLPNGKFAVLPRSLVLSELPEKHFLNFDPLHYIVKATMVERGHLSVVDEVQSNNGYNLYRSKLDINGTTFQSSDKVFSSSSSSNSRREALVIGSYRIGSETFYESLTHSRFALMMVVMKCHNMSFEDLFLKNIDVVNLTPDSFYAQDTNRSSSQRIQAPICTFLRSIHGIIAVDFDQLRYMDQSRWMKIDQGRGQLPIDLHQKCWDADRKAYVDLSREKINYYELKKEKTSKWNEGIVQFIQPAKYIIGNYLPINAIKIQICGDDFEDDLIPNGFRRCTVQHNHNNRRLDHYYFSPKQRIRFRSKAEVQKFVKMLDKTNGDELEAYKIFKGAST